jgi:L-ascorbate metabolism protein UlaG (beta-lactamase superfamily)
MENYVTPISHATMVLRFGSRVVYTDTVGGADAFAGQLAPDIILVTDIHGDHFSAETLFDVAKENTVIVVPWAVADMLTGNPGGSVVVLKNGEKTSQKGIEIEAVAMYNIPSMANSFHTKGRGNGYVVSAEGRRIYIAGDTSATPEMRGLKNIDVAFVPMNLPYTMTVEEAAGGVLAFAPKVVHPYHYRGSDVKRFKELVEKKDRNIKVDLIDFYPGE